MIAVALILLLLPLGLGVALGWYGLNPLETEKLSPVAAFSHELLNSFPDGHLIVEIAGPPGGLPPAASVSVLWSRMNETLSKSSITFQLETYAQSSSGALSTNDLYSLEGQVRKSWPTIGTMSLFYLFVDGSYGGGSQVLGLTYGPSSIAVFPNVVTSGSPPSTNAPVFSTVLVHEFGHELGLVGLLGSAPNEDPAHPGHSTDPNDVMYWQVETTGILSGLVGGQGPPNQFDSADLSDLQTVKATVIPQEIAPWIVLAVMVVAALAVVVISRRQRRRAVRTGTSTP